MRNGARAEPSTRKLGTRRVTGGFSRLWARIDIRHHPRVPFGVDSEPGRRSYIRARQPASPESDDEPQRGVGRPGVRSDGRPPPSRVSQGSQGFVEESGCRAAAATYLGLRNHARERTSVERLQARHRHRQVAGSTVAAALV
ncbi:hypothetical protein BD413DRAFT_520245 [Trametes elegans]|nr:hypothetical protein BD413DRAFT_520245 [Trametes elegans]